MTKSDSEEQRNSDASIRLGLDHAPVIVAVETASVTLEANAELAVHGSRGSHTTSGFTIIRVTTDTGISGYGEVSATPGWSGEDGMTAVHMVRDVIRPLLVGHKLVSVAAATLQVDRVLAGNPFTKAGVNMALWDVVGRASGRRVAELLGGPFREEVPIKMSLSGDGDALATCINAVKRRGIGSFKVKVGIDVESDVARFTLARKLVGAEAFLGADANGGWSRLEAVRAIPQLASLGATFIEQPVAPGDVDGLHRLRSLGLPVLADESVFSLSDVARVIHADAVDAVSVYVGKIGALEHAVLALRTLALFGIDALIGSNGEMGIGAAAQLHVACASQTLSSTIPSDIIGQLYYDEETLVEPIKTDGRYAYLPGGPGLGVEPVPEIVRLFA